MFKFKTYIAVAALVGALSAQTQAHAGDAVCGVYAFAGAFQNYDNARQQAYQFGGTVLNLDRSNSPNAGLGYYVVAKGPTRNQSRANRWARDWRYDGVRGAYAAHRCFYVSYEG